MWPFVIYEGHPINKFQNVKNLKYTFCRKFIPEYQLWVLLLALWTQSVSTVFYRPAFFPNVKQHYELHEKMNKFKSRPSQTLNHTFFSNISSIFILVFIQTINKLVSVFFINIIYSFINTFSTVSKLLTPNMYCWSCKTLVSMHWIDLSVNAVGTNSFWPQKTNNRILFLAGYFLWQCHHL